MTQDREFDPRQLIAMLLAGGSPPRFSMGELVITTNAMGRLDRESWIAGLRRHLGGDWGELDEEDRRANDEALRDGGRLLSAYRDTSGERFWIISEWDRSVTTILLPEDY